MNEVIGIEKRILVSSYGITGIESNDIYMAVKIKLLSDRRNQNNMRVTAAFIHRVIAEKCKYIGTPLVVDKVRLERGEYTRLTHLQDEQTGSFLSEQIGSFVAFETLQEGTETVLVGTARVEKRFGRACAAIEQLYEMDRLRVSFEIFASVYEQKEDELVIDAAEGNSLIGMCIVSMPAYEDAKALALVASMTEPPTSTSTPLLWPPYVPAQPLRVEIVPTPVPAADMAREVLTPDSTQEPLEQETAVPPENPVNIEHETVRNNGMNERNEEMPQVEEAKDTNVTLTPSAEKAPAPEKEKETPAEEEETDKKKAKVEQAERMDDALTAMKAELAAMKAANAALEQFKVKWETAEAARLKAEEVRRCADLAQLATAAKLNVETYKDAIAALDYATVVAAAGKSLLEQPEQGHPMQAKTATANGLVQKSGMPLAGSQPDHPYRSLVKDLTI